MDELKKVVIFIPAFNEEKSIASVIDKVHELYPRAPEVPTVGSHFSECDDLIHIKKITSDTHSALFSVSNSCDGYLVFSKPFYPGF